MWLQYIDVSTNFPVCNHVLKAFTAWHVLLNLSQACAVGNRSCEDGIGHK